MKLLSNIIICLSLLLINSCAFRPIPENLKTRIADPDTILKGLTIQFLGNTNILLDDGETRILTDGFLSRPGGLKVLIGKVKPNEKRIQYGLKMAGISQLDAIIPVHSHYDHAMDAPVVANLTGGKLIGSSSTLMIGRGLNLKEDQMQLAPLDTAIKLGKFNIRFIPSNHWKYPKEKMREKLLDQAITTPLIPPAKVNEYKEGISYTIIIEHDSISIAIHGSAGYKENSIKNKKVDVLFIATAGLEVMDTSYIQSYQKHVVEALNPEVIIPIHWDDFTAPLKGGIKTNHRLFNMITGFDLEKAINIVENNNPKRKIAFLELWEKYNAEPLLN